MNSRRFIANPAPDALNPSVSKLSAQVQVVGCSSWVICAVLTVDRSLPVYPQSKDILRARRHVRKVPTPELLEFAT
jgi:hypothetical protein